MIFFKQFVVRILYRAIFFKRRIVSCSFIFSFLIFHFAFYEYSYACGEDIKREAVEETTIFCPESIAAALKEMRGIFEENNPGHTSYVVEASDLENIYDMCHFKKTPDVVVFSDESLIEKDVSAFIDWYICFASDRIVLAFTNKSKYNSEINEHNWYNIISKKDVIAARANEKISSLGYRTLMMLDLAENYYHQDFSNIHRNFSSQNIFSTEKELTFLLLSADLDYVFTYLSSALQYDLKYIALPDEIDLGCQEFKNNYSLSQVIRGNEVFTGCPIHYVISVPNSVKYPERGSKFLKTMFSKEGIAILQKHKIRLIEQVFHKRNESLKSPEGIEDILKDKIEP